MGVPAPPKFFIEVALLLVNLENMVGNYSFMPSSKPMIMTLELNPPIMFLTQQFHSSSLRLFSLIYVPHSGILSLILDA